MSRAAGLLVWTSLCVGLAVVAAACSKASDTWSFEQRLAVVTKHAEAAMQCVRERWVSSPDRRRMLDRLGLEFDAQLEAIAEVTDDPLLEYARTHEGNDPTAKFIVMANYFREEDDRIREIAEYFSSHVVGNRYSAARPLPPEVTAEWARPGDQLAWEYFLLRPFGPSPRNGNSMDWQAPTALLGIRDSSSVLAVKLAIQSALTARCDHDGVRNFHLREFVHCLANIPSQQSLDALLDFPSWIKAAPAYVSRKDSGQESFSPPEPLTVLLDAPAEELRTALRWDKRGRWKRVLAEFAKGATPERRAQLDQLLPGPLEELLKEEARPDAWTGMEEK